MANRPHVPKFGDWNNQDQPFTVVFDNARVNKRQDLYESIENSDLKPQAKATPPPPQPAAPRPQRPVPPKPLKDETPRPPPPQPERTKVRAPPPNQLYQGGSGGRSAGKDGSGAGGGLYGGFGVGDQRQQPPAPRPPTQPKRNTGRGGGTTIPPFPGSLGAGENMSYTHIFDQVKEERREGVRSSYGGTGSTGHTPSRPINGQHESSASNSSKVCCFPWFRKGSRY